MSWNSTEVEKVKKRWFFSMGILLSCKNGSHILCVPLLTEIQAVGGGSCAASVSYPPTVVLSVSDIAGNDLGSLWAWFSGCGSCCPSAFLAVVPVRTPMTKV